MRILHILDHSLPQLMQGLSLTEALVALGRLLPSGGVLVLQMVNSGVVEKRPLLLGLSNDKFVEVKDGLAEDDKVILNPRAVIEDARRLDGRTGQPLFRTYDR